EVERLRRENEELRRKVGEQQKQISEREKQISEQEKQISDLERQLAGRQKNSSNSSKPPSSDSLTKPSRPGKQRKKGKRKAGGQTGCAARRSAGAVGPPVAGADGLSDGGLSDAAAGDGSVSRTGTEHHAQLRQYTKRLGGSQRGGGPALSGVARAASPGAGVE